jgi:uncharacterized membrane protein YhaH (DUF805 family)
MTILQKLFSFKGRLRRRDFWICTLIIWGTSTVGYGLAMAVAFMAVEPDPGRANGSAMAMTIGSFVVMAAMLWPNLAVNAKRLHDRGKSAGVVTVFYLPFLLMLVPALGLFLYYGATVAVFVYWLIDLGILDGQSRGNTYGPSPKSVAVEAVFA